MLKKRTTTPPPPEGRSGKVASRAEKAGKVGMACLNYRIKK